MARLTAAQEHYSDLKALRRLLHIGASGEPRLPVDWLASHLERLFGRMGQTESPEYLLLTSDKFKKLRESDRSEVLGLIVACLSLEDYSEVDCTDLNLELEALKSASTCKYKELTDSEKKEVLYSTRKREQLPSDLKAFDNLLEIFSQMVCSMRDSSLTTDKLIELKYKFNCLRDIAGLCCEGSRLDEIGGWGVCPWIEKEDPFVASLVCALNIKEVRVHLLTKGLILNEFCSVEYDIGFVTEFSSPSYWEEHLTEIVVEFAKVCSSGDFTEGSSEDLLKGALKKVLLQFLPASEVSLVKILPHLGLEGLLVLARDSEALVKNRDRQRQQAALEKKFRAELLRG